MNGVQYATRVALLWVTIAIASSYSIVMYLLVEPTALEEALSGEMDGMAMDGGAGYYLAVAGIIPLAMVVMNVLADNRWTRIVNLVVAGLVFGVWSALDTASHLVEAGISSWVLVSGASVLIAFLIAGLSFSAARKPTAGPSAGEHERIESRGEAMV